MSKRVTVPRLIDVVETEGKVILFIEYVEGKIANNLSLDKKIKVYWEVVSFLEYLGKNFTKKEKSMVSKRTNADFLLLYPFLLAKAIISHPTYAIILLKGGFRYFLYCTSILKRKKEIFIHRDLHLKNVIISKRKAYLIDLEFCVISDLLYELITTLRVRWHEKKFSQNILKNIIKEFGKNKGFEKLFKALVINSATHGLTAKFEKKKISYWIEFLKFGMDFKINKINVYEK